MPSNSVGIVGQGFVGTAVREGFRGRYSVLTYDKKQPKQVVVYVGEEWLFNNDVKEPLNYLVRNTDGPIFLCLPTPMLSNGSCNTDIVYGVVDEISHVARKGQTVVIKSTCPPGTTKMLQGLYPDLRMVFNPEFLTEANATDDFLNQDRIVLGGRDVSQAREVYEQAFPGVPIVETTATEAEMVKYVTNVFLATKVSLANELKQVCDKLGIDWCAVAIVASLDERLGKTHWCVPNGGKLGWGGSCFPKDLNALIYKASSLGVDPKVMLAVWEKNLEVRPERDWEQLKGRAVA